MPQVADRGTGLGGRFGDLLRLGQTAGEKSGSSPRSVITRRAMPWSWFRVGAIERSIGE